MNQQGKRNTFGYLRAKVLRQCNCSAWNETYDSMAGALDGSQLQMRGFSLHLFCNNIK